MSRTPCRLHLCVASLCLVVSVAGAKEQEAPRTVRSSDVVGLAAAGNPGLKTALLEEQRAAAAVEAEDGLYPFVLGADGGLTHQSTPMTAANGSVSHRTVDQIALGASLRKSLPVGTNLALSVDGNRQVADGAPTGVGLATSSEPTYGLSAKLSATQPLLRGAGKRVGQASLRGALAAQAVAQCAAKRSASELAKAALVAYWELWYAEQALEIDRRARDIAQAQVEEMQARIEQGAAAPADALGPRTRLSTLEETVIAAAAERDRLAVQLEALTGLIRDGVRLAPDLSEQPPVSPRSASDEAVPMALENAPAVREAAAALYAAQDKARVAGESLRQRLDLIGWLEAQTLGVDEVSPLVTQLGDAPAYSGYVGLAYELPLSNQRQEAQQTSARLEVDIARQKLVAATDQARADATTALRAVENAHKRVALAEQTLAVAKEQAEAARQRAAAGAAIYVEVRDAEESAREAALRVTRARVDLALAEVTLNHTTGALLARLP